MSLLKRNGKSKKGQESSQSLDPPQSPSLFRKSTSIEPSGSDIERPQSQQSSRSSSKKKILPSFLSSFFGNNQKIPEVPQSVKNESEPGVEARATSHESINSVLSSSSFSYVNPTNMGGKRVKGKRIPVDDPNYGKTTVGKSKEEKKSSGLSTLDKIGIKMGLKKKYNLQSCESLQYIDACEDSDPIPLQTSSITKKNQTELPGTSNNPLSGVGQIEADSPGSSNGANPSPPTAEKFTKITVELQKLSELASSPDIISTSVLQTEVKTKENNRFSDCSSQTVIEPPSTPTSSQIANQVIKKKSKKIADSPPIVVMQVINDPPKVSPKAEPEPSITVLKSNEPIASTSNAPEPTTPAVKEPSQLTTVETLMEKPPPTPVQEPQPSTSAAALQFSFASNSNTWSNSGRRKRRAPLPPIVLGENPALPKFTNGLSKDLASTSIVSDTPNDVPSSSSGAAQLRKFTRIEESPPPRTAFEIRPRKKERSVEPMPVTRPTSSFATAVATNTLFSSHNHRYHKRSCSEGTSSASSTLNRGKLHKQGKKRAPPPPNPFGDPDVPEEEAPSTSAPNSTLKLSSETASAVPGTSSSSAVVSLPPTAPPKLHRKSSFTKSKSVDAKASTSKVTAQVSINPFESEPETPSPPRTASPVPTSIAVAETAPTTSTSVTENSNSMENVSPSHPEQVTLPAPDSVLNLPDCSPDLLEEIRQNMINDQQERQQMGLLQGNHTQDLSMNDDMRTDDEINTDIENRSIASDRPVSVVQPSSSRTSTPISETDLVSAQRKLEVLASSIAARPSSSSPSGSTVDPATKAKLIELKKESDKSPLNALRNKSRPISLGSSIYESPLALFLGKASNSSAGPSNGNATNNPESSGESSPKITPKPWYKRGTSNALAKQLSSNKSKQQPQVKPFTSLVKFSELDKEATRIVEENRRKSAEQRMQETEQELLELFATLDNSTNVAESGEVPSASNESPQSPRSVQIVTAAQVHTEGTSASSNGTVDPANDEARPASPSRTENSSPTFQSVHAASKHRKIKPLLTSSPGAIVRSEKLAIVQPQTNNTASSVTGAASSSSTATSTSINSSPSIPTTHTSNSSNGPTTPSSVTATTTSSTPISTRAPGPEWDCPRCTLKNPSWRILCEICFQRKDPPPSATSYISSILQRVNAESTKPATSSATTPTTPPPSTQTASSVTTAAAASSTSSFPTTPGVTKTQSSPTEIPSSIPSVVDNPPSTSQSNFVQDNQISTLSEPSSAIQPSTRIEKHDIPPCENFLSQLPDKHDHAKEEKLSGIKLHEDPELEELDIRKLRKARLAYFQKQQSTSKDSSENPQNDFSLSTSSMQKHNGRIVSSASETNELGSSAMSTNSTAKTFADNEDDFLDYILQLDSNPYENDPPNVQNISLLPVPLLSHFSPSQEETNGALSSDMNAPPSLSLSETNPSTVCMASPQTRFKPKLEAIVEGNSQDYAYCYSSSEVAQIYENWQTRPITSQNSVASLSNIPSGVSSQQNRNNLVEQTPETPSLAHHLQRSAQTLIPHYLSNACPILHNGNSVLAPHPVPILPAVLADHQPYANNRLSDSPEKNYVNANIRGTSWPTPTPRQEQISCTTTSSTPVSCQHSFINRLNICGEETQGIPEGSGNFVQTCGENRSMSGNGGRRFTYDDYRRMGAIPKGFPMRNQCDDWSSESSSDSSRGLPLLGSRGSGFSDSSPGLTRRGTLDGSLSPNVVFPEQTLAVSKLMKRLEAAITNGDHRLAATLAHDLALMKVNCVVSKINQPFSIRVYVEDRCMQQGPFVVQVTSMMTVRDLKLKIEGDWGIPAGFQRWILGRQMAEDDTQSLTSFEITQDSMAFLFLVTPEIGNAKSGILPIDKKINNHSVLPSGPSPSTSTSVSNQIPGKSAPSSSKDKTHSSNNLTEPGPHSSTTQPTYNNISKGPSLDKPQSPSAPRKVSSVSQTTATLLAPSSKKSSAAKRETSPPPRPAKSPTPKATPTKVVSQASPSTPKKATPSSTPPRKSSKQEIKKETQSSTSAAETISTATALTLSLQQKLSEFRAVAEQTFGKSNIVTLPPKHDGVRKDASPAPTSSKILNTGRSQESPARQKVEIVDGKPPPVRKSTKTASTSISSSKEKLAATPPKELPPDSAVVPENRFNGVLLQTPKDTNELKPPERKNTPSPSPKQENSVQPKPEVPKEMDDNSVLDKVGLPSPPPSDNVRSPTPDAAPLPKPRGVKRQSTVEKVSQGTESPTIIVPLESVAPKPFPRKVSSPDSIAKREASAEPPAQAGPPPTPLIEPPVSAAEHPTQLDPQASVQLSQPSLHGHPMNEVKIENTQDSVTVDDCCQTTLPFPAAKPKFSNSPTDSTSATYFPSDPTPSTSTQSGPLSLLRPSAFVSQIKTEGTYFNSPTQPIAHVQPLKQPTPTARVSPSPAISSSSNTGGTAPQPEKEDSAQSYLKMLELMEKQDLILTCEDTECPVCFVPVPKGEGVILRDCLHVFCRECLVGCVQYADDSTVKCPYRDNDYACNYNLQEREIKALVPPDVFEKYLARSVKLAESKIVNTFHCKTPDCTGWCVFEDDVNTFMCPVCKKRNCLTCAAIHEGIDCQKYQRELAIAAETDEDAKQSRLMLEKMIQRGEALDCPACHVVLLKKWGCDWVRCSYCKTEICWVTKGFRWGPGGKGDVSGGCKCGINGVKCHPKCTYCH